MQFTESALDDVLKSTSRAFYLSLAVLPPEARSPLSLAYLLARAADTVADTPGADPDQVAGERLLDQLESFKEAVLEPDSWKAEALAAWNHLASSLPEDSGERRLLEYSPGLVEMLARRPEAEREAIREVVSTLIDGMIWDQQLFGDSSRARRRAQQGLGDEELERYTYLVAGCVGPFWSTVCAMTDPRLHHLLDYHDLAVEFGRALQWVNILRDVPEDHRLGRFYLPELQNPIFKQRFRSRARRALSALRTATRYPLLFPRFYLRHRMAVFWPLVLGLRTMELLLAESGPRPGQRSKVARWEVLGWVALSPLLVLSDRGLSYVLNRLGRRAEKALSNWEEAS
jgi:farnesyl-diphosphate farnesyltransferase